MLSTVPDRVREAAWSRWLARVLGGYEPSTAAFYRREGDRFANPVGQTLATELRVLVAGVLAGVDPAAGAHSPAAAPDTAAFGGAESPPTAERMAAALEAVVRVRAVQQLAPSAAVGFVYELAPALREAMSAAAVEPDAELATALGAAVERLALAAFDAYVRCRDRIHELRLAEAKRSVAMLVRHWTAVYDAPPGAEPPAEVSALQLPGGAR